MRSPTIEDVLGSGQTKLGFFHDWQLKLQELEEAHAESERRRLANAAILEAIPDLMMVIDEDSRIISVNHVVEGLFPERELLGAHCHKLLRGRASPCPDCPARMPPTPLAWPSLMPMPAMRWPAWPRWPRCNAASTPCTRRAAATDLLVGDFQSPRRQKLR